MATITQRAPRKSGRFTLIVVLVAVAAVLAIAFAAFPAQPAASDTDAGTVGGEPVAVSEAAERLFAGSDEEAIAIPGEAAGLFADPAGTDRVVTSALAGYPLAEDHVRLFTGSDRELLPVDSSIAGQPVAEAHARLFAGV